MKVGIVVFDKFLTSEVTAPIEIFAKAGKKGSVPFAPFLVAEEKKVVVSEEGLRVEPDYDFANCPPIDVLVVPSGLDVEPLLANEKLIGFIKDRAEKAKFVASNCAGAFLLGKACLLEGRRVTTYIGGTEDLAKRFPKAKVVDNEHIVTDGNMMSSIGELHTYDASLALVAKIAGKETADKTAEALYYFPWGKPRS